MLSRSGRSALLHALVALGIALAPSRSESAGFAIFEQGARGMGFAGAFTAQASDPSAIFHNAAGIAFLKGNHLTLGGALIAPSTDFTGADPYPGSGRLETMNVGIAPVPAVYFTHQFTARLVGGVGLNAPFGLKTSWDSPETFTGRFLSQRAELKGLSINPTVAYKLADRLSAGVGLDIRMTSVSLERNVPVVNPFTQTVVDASKVLLDSDTATDFGWNLGVLGKPTENLSFGLAYRNKVKQDFSGAATFTAIPTSNAQLDALVALRLPSGALPATTVIEFPSIFSVGVAYSWQEWTIEGDVDFYEWSTFDSLPISFEGRPDLSSVVLEEYTNSRQYRVGVEREIDEFWAVRGGYYYDASPAPTPSVSPLLPDAARQGFCLGGSWSQGHLRLDAATWYVKFKERSTEDMQRDDYNGTYTGKAITFGLSLGYSF
jgi:long-chain fatty acid transport protein